MGKRDMGVPPSLRLTAWEESEGFMGWEDLASCFTLSSRPRPRRTLSSAHSRGSSIGGSFGVCVSTVCFARSSEVGKPLGADSQPGTEHLCCVVGALVREATGEAAFDPRGDELATGVPPCALTGVAAALP